MGKIFNKGLSEDDQEEGLFKSVEDIENAQKKLIRNDGNDDKDDKGDKDDKDEIQQTNNIDTKPLYIFNYLKSLSQEANDLMDEKEEVNSDIDIHKLLFIGNNKEKFNFNTTMMPLNFLSDIYNGKISLKEAEFKQRDLEIEIRNLQFGYESKDKKEKEEKSQVLMQENDLLEYRDKIVDAFKDGIFLSKIKKKQMMLLMILH